MKGEFDASFDNLKERIRTNLKYSKIKARH